MFSPFKICVIAHWILWHIFEWIYIISMVLVNNMLNIYKWNLQMHITHFLSSPGMLTTRERKAALILFLFTFLHLFWCVTIWYLLYAFSDVPHPIAAKISYSLSSSYDFIVILFWSEISQKFDKFFCICMKTFGLNAQHVFHCWKFTDPYCSNWD